MARRSSATEGQLSDIHNLLDEDNKEILAAWNTKHNESPTLSAQNRSTAARSSIGTQPRKKRFDPGDPSTWTSAHSVVTAPTQSTPFDERTEIDRRPSKEHDIPHNIEQLDSSTGRTSRQHSAVSIEEPRNIQSLGSSIANLSLAEYSEPRATTEPTVLALRDTPAGLQPADQADRRFSNKSTSFSTVDSENTGRIIKDHDPEDEAVDDSSDDDPYRTSGDEGSPVAERGRRRDPDDGHEDDRPATPKSPRIEISDTSIPDNDASVPKPPPPHPISHSGVFSESKSGIHPRSNYNRASSPAALSALGDDDAELRRAKALPLRVSPLDDKVPDRHVKMIIRGEWSAFQDQDEEEHGFRHEPRLYLVCSDLSNEATYALEWTVGTLLKDGDTLLAISAMEDENAPQLRENEEPSMEISMESMRAAQQTNSIMSSLTKVTSQQAENPPQEKKTPVAAYMKEDRSGSRGGRTNTQKDERRISAVEKLEADFLKFVRKTTLQVRCMIEVIHCRSPRHLLLNAIDELEPTLVVVGTRGLGTVKNVVMGSFSNYLVTKSSIPVMVARKRLKKARHAKVSSQHIRMTNNLTPLGLSNKRKSLTQARID